MSWPLDIDVEQIFNSTNSISKSPKYFLCFVAKLCLISFTRNSPITVESRVNPSLWVYLNTLAWKKQCLQCYETFRIQKIREKGNSLRIIRSSRCVCVEQIDEYVVAKKYLTNAKIGRWQQKNHLGWPFCNNLKQVN